MNDYRSLHSTVGDWNACERGSKNIANVRRALLPKESNSSCVRQLSKAALPNAVCSAAVFVGNDISLLSPFLSSGCHPVNGNSALQLGTDTTSPLTFGISVRRLPGRPSFQILNNRATRARAAEPRRKLHCCSYV